LREFYNEVKSGAPIDLKSQDEWRKHPLYIYNNEILDADAFGNILYGVLGAYLDIPKWMLKEGADFAQKFAMRNPFVQDDPRDVRQWEQGIRLYYDKWINKADDDHNVGQLMEEIESYYDEWVKESDDKPELGELIQDIISYYKNWYNGE